MKQNIYDNPDFYSAYIHLRETGTGLNDVLEIPAFRSLLPGIAGLHVLDLGCGFGESCRWYAEQGAAAVTGVDISGNMIERARQSCAHPAVDFRHLPIEDIDYASPQFDLVLSSLAFHYIADWPALLARIHAALKPGGYLIFSQEHPVMTAKKLPAGWAADETGPKGHWILDNYGEEGLRRQNWLVDGVIKYHRTLSSILNGLIAAGFLLCAVLEPAPSPEAEKNRPSLQNERRRPPFLLVKARKPPLARIEE